MVLLAVLAACGNGSDSLDIAAGDLPLGPPDSEYWVAGSLPADFRLVNVREHDSGRGTKVRQIEYQPGDVLSDSAAGALTVEAVADDGDNLTGSRGTEPSRVRGHDAVQFPVTDDGETYGVGVRWHERPGLTITVHTRFPVGEVELYRVAEHVQPISAQTWAELMAPYAIDQGAPAADMERVEAARGDVNGQEWVLTALLPADYPLVEADRRSACYELSYGGATTTGISCGRTSWVRLAGENFVVGQASVGTERVDVSTPDGLIRVSVEPVRVDRGPPTLFWVAPMPAATPCFAFVYHIGADGQELRSSPVLPLPSQGASCGPVPRPSPQSN